MTLLQALIDQLLQATKAAQDSRPRALLWTDESKEWADVIPRLRGQLPQLLTMGSYAPDQRQGPTVYLLFLIDQMPGTVPILYLPGVGKAKLRAVAELEWNLQPLAALQYQSLFWVQENGKDWTRLAFATSEKGAIRWSIASDEASKEAFRRTFLEWLDREITESQGRTLNEGDFNASVVDDTGAMMLRWIQSPEDLGAAFAAEVKKTYQIDVKKQTNLDALNRLAKGGSKSWDALWSRFFQSPATYPGVVSLLAALKPDPNELIVDESRYPSVNQTQETDLAQAMMSGLVVSVTELRSSVAQWEKKNSPRRTWVWKQLGLSPLAEALGPLADLAQRTAVNIFGTNFVALAASYTSEGWKADLAFLKVLAHPIPLEHRQTYRTLAHRLYRPWLEQLALQFQKLNFGDYPRRRQSNLPDSPEGTCILFVDGLRWDLGLVLSQRLQKTGAKIDIQAVWSALPTVTATAKPAVSPLEPYLAGSDSPTDFEVIETYHFRKQLAARGWIYLDQDEKGDGKGRAWTENGELDTKGHNGDLPVQYSAILDEVVWRIQGLLGAGWTTVKVVTDHGWLLLPEGLPKTDLPGVLTPNRGERAAWLHPGNPGTELQAPWFWNPLLSYQTGPGISAFHSNLEYAHGGLSLQECVIPEIVITGSHVTAHATETVNLVEMKWAGMWLKMNWSFLPDGYLMDLRMSAGDPSSTILGNAVALSPKLVVSDDAFEGKEVWFVVQDPQRRVVFQQKTKVGGMT